MIERISYVDGRKSVYICDRCKRRRLRDNVVEVVVHKINKRSTIENKHLCQSCFERFNKFMEEVMMK